MSTIFTDLLKSESRLKDVIKKPFQRISGLCNVSAKCLFLSTVFKQHSMVHIWLVNEDSAISEITGILEHWSAHKIFGLFEESSKSMYASAIEHVSKNKACVIVTTPDILQSTLIQSFESIQKRICHIEKNISLSPIDAMEIFQSMGYESVMHDVERPGQFVKKGGIISVFPVGYNYPVEIDFFGNEIDTIHLIKEKTKEEQSSIDIFPINVSGKIPLISCLKECHLIVDEIDKEDPYIELSPRTTIIDPFASGENIDLHFTSVLRYNTPIGFIDDIKEKLKNGWHIGVFNDREASITKLLKEHNIKNKGIQILTTDIREKQEQKEIHPEGFVNHNLKLFVVSAFEIFNRQRNRKRSKKAEVDAAFLANLKPNDYVVHIDHGIGAFSGIQKNTFDTITKEYLYIRYAKNDKLYVPVDQAEKVNKYIGVNGMEPKLTRLGSTEWTRVTKKMKEETLKLAKELLELYAKREEAKGYQYQSHPALEKTFADAFAYSATDGQAETILEVKEDMERLRPMDRLVCGDVGFGKTEVAMRSAFKAVQDNKQVAVLTPITILCNQHFKTFTKRMAKFNVRIAELSRFKSAAEQKRIKEQLAKGEIDIVIGTHSLLSDSIKFHDLGLIIIDEEQRFGVKQKEKLKHIKLNTDILTLTATPIPRTLNMALAGLRDISTITTPPPGRLPIHTEVRRFDMNLIREVIMRELDRDGQIFFLHNRVQTIESMREKLETLVPEAKFLVAHGQLSPQELEKRIIKFKAGEYQVLISSTIIENGIDLERANTLIVDQAENLGLSQAYQLRGRVGRSKTQAYAYFLYHAQKLKDDAKRRLKAIIEASDLGSGFQIAMRDLEIRGAGDILGSKQHGVMNTVGVTHFCRLLAKTIDDIRNGKFDEKSAEDRQLDVKIDLKLSAYIPDNYIQRSIDKIRYYQRLSGVDNTQDLKDLGSELQEQYGVFPEELINLFHLLEIKIACRDQGILGVREFENQNELFIEMTMGKNVTPKAIINLLGHVDQWQIIESKLKINVKYLGKNWIKGLKRSIGKLRE